MKSPLIPQESGWQVEVEEGIRWHSGQWLCNWQLLLGWDWWRLADFWGWVKMITLQSGWFNTKRSRHHQMCGSIVKLLLTQSHTILDIHSIYQLNLFRGVGQQKSDILVNQLVVLSNQNTRNSDQKEKLSEEICWFSPARMVRSTWASSAQAFTCMVQINQQEQTPKLGTWLSQATDSNISSCSWPWIGNSFVFWFLGWVVQYFLLHFGDLSAGPQPCCLRSQGMARSFQPSLVSLDALTCAVSAENGGIGHVVKPL